MTSEGRPSDRIVLLDRGPFVRFVLRVTLACVLVLTTYAVAIYLLFDTAPLWLTSVTIVALQLLMGMYLVKKLHGLGAIARGRWRFQDPSTLGADWQTEQDFVQPTHVQRLFDRLHAIASKHDTDRLDDLTDIGWFVVVLQATLTGALFLLGTASVPVSLISTLTIALVSVAMFLDGYHSSSGTYMEEDIEHLEYLVRGRLAAFDAAAAGCPVSDVILWSRRGSTIVLSDIGKSIEGKSDPSSRVALTYWVGMSAAAVQRFDIRCDDAPETVASVLSSLPLATAQDWSVKTADGWTEVSKPSNSIRLGDRASFLVSPTEAEDQFSFVRSCLAEIMERLVFVCSSHNLNESHNMQT